MTTSFPTRRSSDRRMSALGAELPKTFDAVLRLAADARAAGRFVAVPAVPIDAFCMVFTLAANLGRPLREEDDGFADAGLLDPVLGPLADLVGLCPPRPTAGHPLLVLQERKSDEEGKEVGVQ